MTELLEALDRIRGDIVVPVEDMERLLLREKREKAQAAYLAALRERATIRTNEPVLARLPGPRPVAARPAEEARP